MGQGKCRVIFDTFEVQIFGLAVGCLFVRSPPATRSPTTPTIPKISSHPCEKEDKALEREKKKRHFDFINFNIV